MNSLSLSDVSRYVEENIGTFHQKRIAGLTDLKLNRVLGKKNPYLFKAKYFLTAEDIITNKYVDGANDFDHEQVKADAEAFELAEEFAAVEVPAGAGTDDKYPDA